MFKASSSYSVLNNQDLIVFLEKYYRIIDIDSLHLHRSFIGDVYIIKTKEHSYVMKIFKHDALHNSNIENSVKVMDFLYNKGVSVPEVINNVRRHQITTLLAPEGERDVVVTSYISGELTPNLDDETIAAQLAEIRKAMKDYPVLNELHQLDVDEMINRFIEIMNEYYPDKDEEVEFFRSYGAYLSKKIKELNVKYPESIGFCHGDFHTGNIIKTSDSEVTFIDFDACTIGSILMDIATYCNQMDYFNFDASKLGDTFRKVEIFTKSYSDTYSLSQEEIEAIPLYIALRHYELNATVPLHRVPVEGKHWLNDNWLESQYTWLKKWQKIHHLD